MSDATSPPNVTFHGGGLGGCEAWMGPLKIAGSRVNLGSATTIHVIALGVVLAAIGLFYAFAPGWPAGLAAVGMVVLVWAVALVRERRSGRLMARLRSQAHTDDLTQLPNARSLDDRLEALARSYVGPLNCLTINLDRFTDVNERLGRAAGDQLLRGVANGLRGLTGRLGGDVYRSGGDEFVVLTVDSHESAEAIADHVSEVVTSAMRELPGLQRVPVGSSVGIAQVMVVKGRDEATSHPRVAVGRSVQAMRQAKAERLDVALFDQHLADSRQRARLIEEALRERLATGVGIDVHFQPVMALDDRRMVGAEALARWAPDELGAVPATEFIAIAEDTGLIEELGTYVLRAALDGAVSAGLIARGHTLAVNVSGLQLRASGFAKVVTDELDRAGVPAERLTIEVTESVLLYPHDPAVVTLEELAERGVRVCLDDFGTGYSSLAYLTRLPVAALKLDHTLTASLEDPRSVAIAGAIGELARRLDLTIVVEGIETRDQELLVRGLGLKYVQGMLYAPALPLREMAELLAQSDQPEGS